MGHATTRPKPWLALLLLGGCAGISLGDSGESDDGPDPCSADAIAVTELTAELAGFERTPEALLASAERPLSGALQLVDGSEAMLEVVLEADRGQLVSFHPDAPECAPWLETEVTLSLDAGESLRGRSTGTLSVRDAMQVRGGWTHFQDLEIAPQADDFSQPIVEGPFILVSMLEVEPGRWDIDIQNAARVESEPCDATTQMCTGTPGGWEPAYQPYAAGTLSVSE